MSARAEIRGPAAGRWKRFPPVRGGLLIPRGSAPAAVAALDSVASCRPAGRLVHRAAALWLRTLGTAALPGPAESWAPPLAAESWDELLRSLSRELPFDAYAVLQRRQPHRPGFAALLVHRGVATGFLKLRPLQGSPLAREADALARLAAAAPHAFSAPVLLRTGSAAEWEWLLQTALPGRHRVPRRPSLEAVTEGIRRALAEMPRAAGTPAHWEPMHGDLTPWNLREAADGSLRLYDWEDAGWGPPGADAVLFGCALAALGLGRDAELAGRWPEAARFWAERIRARPAADRGEARLRAAELALLEGGR